MPPDPQQPQTDDQPELDTVQHPVLGTLKFPKDMGPDERNEVIERHLAERPNNGLAPAAGAPPSRTEAAKKMDAGQPSPLGVLTQPLEKTDKEYLGYTGPTGVTGATVHGLANVARGTGEAMKAPFVGAYNDIKSGHVPLVHSMISEPMQEMARDIPQIPEAIRDINASPDPKGSYMKAAEDTADQGAGQALTGLAGAGLMKAYGAIPRASRAGQTLEGVTNVMRGKPVATAPVDAAAMDALTQHEHGAGSLPPPVRKYIKYTGGPGAMRQFPGSSTVPFEDMRDFQSNSGRLSAKDMKAMSPKMKRELGNFAAATAKANQDAAVAAGQGEPYAKGMNEFRRAMKMRDFGNNAVKAAGAAAGGYGAYRLAKRLAPELP